VTAAREEIEERREDWKAAVNACDIDAYADLVVDDLVWLPPAGRPIEGRERFRAWLMPFFEAYDYDFSVEPIEVRVFDGWCAEAGRFRSVMSPKGGGDPQEHGGNYALIWRQDTDDGEWRIERYVDGFGSRLGSSGHETSA